MKIKNIKTIGLFTILTTFSLVSCNDDFLAEKEDFGGVNEQVFQDPSLATAYVDYIYKSILPPDNAAAMTWDLAAGGADIFSRTSDELAGETAYNKTYASLNATTNSLPYLGARMGTSVANNTWTRLKQINIFLNEVDKYTGIDETKKNQLKGQLYFWRAWQYFDMVKLYGGVPLVLTAQNPILDAASDSKIARSSTSECIEQIVADLDMAKSLLPGKWVNGADWGRITSGAAAAFKGRVLLTWASPLFNPSDNTARWQRAYDANLAAKILLEANGSGLFVAGGTANGKAWGDMWFTEANNPEAVIVYGFNNSIADQIKRNNGWERACRSKEVTGAGSLSPTKQIVDAFPMADGTSIVGNPSYNPVLFYKGRDPRFAKTFVHNGATWGYAEKTTFKQWTYSWYTTAPANSTVVPNKFTETLGANSTAIYLSKSTSPTASNANSFAYSGTDFMEMRFAEVVLNLAESAIGINKLAEGKDLIRTIRVRAGLVVGLSDYGLASVSSRDQHFAAVLNERKIELAYEGKRFYDLRRWKLFDATAGTTARLGVTPINGSRRTGYFIVAKKTDGNKYVHLTVDPFLANNAGVAPIVNREPTSFPYIIPTGAKLAGTSIASEALYLEYLYTNYFEIVVRDNIEATVPANWTFKWYNEYNFFGIPQTLLDTAPYLEQTQGWGGTFDPLK
ncbi:RagB/SusD family nutrient uptake outer membrane protein [Flavobacterium sp. LB2P84]|uniref:RagB/SusD family nutrient uptake outer membrane protein n=1 Tax=Flavobacterium yafengii TaxID=3041253 RepID=UPI0024A87403|nr:RagB/SusD family nutrient uptake outer membrane protein [Flavobacterium yafengii]MDI6033875.1 RagB/SusD family nutrient uptake outer membrane protein [Flavobacterium yafengii]